MLFRRIKILNNRIQFAIDNFILENYFLPISNNYNLKEKTEKGKSLLKLYVKDDNICVEEYDSKKRCAFLKTEKKFGMQKCIDHFILVKRNHGWDLCMIEMKSGVGFGEWRSIKEKVRSSLYNIKALCVFLGITIDNTYIYTTYERLSFQTTKDTADIKAHIPLLGSKAINYKEDEWDKNIIKVDIDLDIIKEFPHQAIKMTRNANGVLEGNLTI